MTATMFRAIIAIDRSTPQMWKCRQGADIEIERPEDEAPAGQDGRAKVALFDDLVVGLAEDGLDPVLPRTELRDRSPPDGSSHVSPVDR